ncbi:hypothetical protein LOTGIDRAFT_115298 [Lottia gigantea]|uniref:RNA helicase n=1 Tax=Lottia gigantea TaxID=225164 RepID=V4AQB7_LOTGI|nr:hypothetical protein LOTGIDRAFT_115298 [Lottia gigantea]ESO97005.1 hypothetical protein LOTGIDRAFT_115298 [Lottia gigantea]
MILNIDPKVKTNIRHKSKKARANERKEKDISSFVRPLKIKPISKGEFEDFDAEINSKLQKDKLIKLLNQFSHRRNIKILSQEHGLNEKLFHDVYSSFRTFCVKSASLPVDLHVVLSDIIHGAGHVDDIFPFFLHHAKEIFPYIDRMEELRKISDIRTPADWYVDARAIQRKIIFHAGPTNSGKTHQALHQFLTAESGVYCGPLRLLASEIFKKCNFQGVDCDLVTGEERKYAKDENSPSEHVACTVEMSSTVNSYKVAIIDEIQMIRDPQRGWAWTRALLGLNAEEIHVCGEKSAINIVQEMMKLTGDTVEVKEYERLTKLTYLKKAVGSLYQIQPGDCIVCFRKNDIFNISRKLEMSGREVAVVYGALPPGTKIAQAERFNDPEDPCKIMVATDAIGMGINLSIKRIVFSSLVKPVVNEQGDKELDVISTSQALQIAGRAGRYGSAYSDGEVTTLYDQDLPILLNTLKKPIEEIKKAGLQPTIDQIEMFSHYLPQATLCNLMDIFVSTSSIDSDNFFLSNMEDFKFLANIIEHIPLELRTRYVFCCAPINKRSNFACSSFLKFARRFSRNEPVSIEWLCSHIDWPCKLPYTISELEQLESVYDTLDMYLWLSYRYTDLFPDKNEVREMQMELDQLIREGIQNVTKLSNKSTEVSEEVQEDKTVKSERNLDERFGKLSQELIRKGIVTPEQLENILKEPKEDS